MRNQYDYRYINGNYLVTYHTYRTLLIKEALRTGEELISNFPDSIDLKITNKCSTGCPFCHENSSPLGKTFDFERTISILEQLPALPIEIAIGGGNILDVVSEANQLVNWLISRGHRVRATVNYKDIQNLNEEQRVFLNKFEGLGISINSLDDELLSVISSTPSPKWLTTDREGLPSHIRNLLKPKDTTYFSDQRVVLHVISGIISLKDLSLLLDNGGLPILLLGYKQWGRAKETQLPNSIKDLESWIKQFIFKSRYKLFGEDSFQYRAVISFDNLALEQLHIKDALLEDEWSKLYMGEEGQHSMYIDAVKEEYAQNSISSERISWNEVGLLEFFKSLQK